MKKYVKINNIKVESTALLLLRLILLVLFFAISLLLLFFSVGLERSVIGVLVAGLLITSAALVSNFEKYEESLVFETVDGLTVAELKALYLSVNRPGHSSQNYFTKKSIEKMIVDACDVLSITTAGLRTGYVGKIKTSRHFVNEQTNQHYSGVRMQYLVDRFFEDHRFDGLIFADLVNMESAAIQ